MELTPALGQKYDLGRVSVWRGPVWDGTTHFFDSLVHVGNTEGDVVPVSNPEYSDLTLPESTGPAVLKRYITGERPEFELGIFPSLAGLKLFSPVGTASAGFEFRQPVAEHALWLVSEQLFLTRDENGRVVRADVSYTAEDGWQKDEEELSDDDVALVEQSLIIWRAQFGRAMSSFRNEDGGKQLSTVSVMVMQDFERPNGCQLFLALGELEEFEDLDLAPLPVEPTP
jgi:hypothetical protein